MKRTIREGSMADKFIRMCNWFDRSKSGNVISLIITGVSSFALVVIGLQCCIL